jgi:hypothetical protein
MRLGQENYMEACNDVNKNFQKISFIASKPEQPLKKPFINLAPAHSEEQGVNLCHAAGVNES